MTHSPWLFVSTVILPNQACRPVSTTAASEAPTIARECRMRSTAKAATARTSSPTTAAIERWIHSIHADSSPTGGNHAPWHVGQSGQPMPEPVARTIAPMTTRP